MKSIAFENQSILSNYLLGSGNLLKSSYRDANNINKLLASLQDRINNRRISTRRILTWLDEDALLSHGHGQSSRKISKKRGFTSCYVQQTFSEIIYLFYNNKTKIYEKNEFQTYPPTSMFKNAGQYTHVRNTTSYATIHGPVGCQIEFTSRSHKIKLLSSIK